MEAAGRRGGAAALQGPEGVLIDLSGYQVWREGVAVPLTRKECQLLQCLASRPGSVVPRRELLVQVEGRRERTLDVYVCRLRRKLNDPQGSYIQTIRKVGYRLSPQAAWSRATSG